MDVLKLRSYARAMMSIGATAIFVGIAIMVHGELNFGDGVLVSGTILLIVGVALLARTPTGDSDPPTDAADDAVETGGAK